MQMIVVPREKPHTGAAARENTRDAPVISRCGPSFPAWPGTDRLFAGLQMLDIFSPAEDTKPRESVFTPGPPLSHL